MVRVEGGERLKRDAKDWRRNSKWQAGLSLGALLGSPQLEVLLLKAV